MLEVKLEISTVGVHTVEESVVYEEFDCLLCCYVLNWVYVRQFRTGI